MFARLLSPLVLVLLAVASASAQPTAGPPASALGDTLRYASAFKQIERLLADGQPQSALTRVDSVLSEATRRGDGLVRIRATMLRAALTVETGPTESNDESEAVNAAFDRLRREAEAATGPLRAILQSQLATSYGAYLRQNFWQISQRTATAAGPRTPDVTTWSARDLADAALGHHRAAVVAAEGATGDTPLAAVAYVLTGPSTYRALRPTVRDLVGHAALDFLEDDFLTSSFPAERYRLASDAWFADPDAFASATLDAPQPGTTGDSSFQAEVGTIYRRLTRAHLSDRDASALLDVSLRRLAFARRHHTAADRDARAEAALRRWLARYADAPHVTAVAADLAQLLAEGGRPSRPPYRPFGGDSGAETTAETLARRREAVQICEAASGRFPSTPGALECRAFVANLRAAALMAQLEDAVTPGRPMRMLVAYANVAEVHARVVALPRGFQARLNRTEWRQRPRVLAELYALTPVQSLRQRLPESDLRTRRAEVALDGVPVGEYAVLLSADGRFTPPARPEDDAPVAFFQATALAATMRGDGKGGLDVHVLDRQTGAAVVGATVRLMRQEWAQGGERFVEVDRAVTGADGYARVAGSERYGYRIELSKGTDTWMGPGVGLGRDGQANESTRAVLFTDRAVYRPGQDVHVKAVLMTTEGRTSRTVEGRALTLRFVDANGQAVATETLTTNEFGSVAMQFTAPTGALTGQMSIEARVGDRVVGSRAVRVEEYRRPRFEVTLDPLDGTPVLGQPVTVTGTAASYAGVGLDAAMVAYRVVRRPMWPWWWWGPRRGGEEQVAFGTTTTDGDGRFSVTFTPAPDPGDDPTSPVSYRYEIEADVTDTSGETQSGSVFVSVGFARLRASVVAPRVLDRADAGADTLRLVVENLDGQPVAASGTVRIERLQPLSRALRARLWERPDAFTMTRAEYERRFPNDAYDREDDIATWPVVGPARTLAFDTAQSRTLRLADLARWDEGVYRITTRATDADGKPVETVQTVTVVDRRTRAMPMPALVWTAMTTETRRVGETARLMVGSSERGVRVRIDVEIDGRIVQTETLALSAEKRTVEVPITEAMRGETVAFHVSAVRANRTFTETHTVSVPSGRDLRLSFETFRSRLVPGAGETWTLRVRGEAGEAVAAEVAAAMYDASLDAIEPHAWAWPSASGGWPRRAWNGTGPGTTGTSVRFPGTVEGGEAVVYEGLDRYGFLDGSYGGRMYRRIAPTAARNEMAMAEQSAGPPPPPPPPSAPPPPAAVPDADATGASAGKVEEDGAAREALGQVQARQNLAETAFFFPTLRPDADGSVRLTFTVPEALTRWRILAAAHTADLRTGLLREDAVTQKDLIVTPNVPRVLREGDRVRITARLDNRAGRALDGQAMLSLLDAATMQPVDAAFLNGHNVRRFAIPADSSAALDWEITVPMDAALRGPIVARVVARAAGQGGAADVSDGEEVAVPVLTNRVLVTETLPLPMRPGQTRSFTFEELLASANRPDVLHQSLTLEVTANPAWLAVLALPSLTEETSEATDATFARLYAGLIATHIARSDPRIASTFEAWRRAGAESLTSPLARNEQLKATILAETPWVQQAADETERRARIATLFDMARTAALTDRALARLEAAQRGDGAWPWFEGGPADRYTTQAVVAGVGRMKRLGVVDGDAARRLDRMATRALAWTTAQLDRDLGELRRAKANLETVEPSPVQVHALYARAFYLDGAAPAADEATAYFRRRAAASWRSYNLYVQSLLALALHRDAGAPAAEKATIQRVITTARETARKSDELGWYWPTDRGWSWFESGIGRQALLIELFDEVAKDAAAVAEMKIWLLKMKQVQDWETRPNTVDAIYALLRTGVGATGSPTDLLAETPDVRVTVGGETYSNATWGPYREAGTGLVRQTWSPPAIRADQGRVTVTNPGRGIAWGALYWQSLQPVENVVASTFSGPDANPLRLAQELFVERTTSAGRQLVALADGGEVRVGDVLVERLVLRVDRAMEYVHLKARRPSGFEPIEQRSGWRTQDALWYYEAPRDASTDYFMGWLPTGTYVFEMRLRARNAGDFAGAMSQVQSVYAPEFTAHSAGHRVRVAP